MNSIVLELFVIGGLCLLNGFLSMSELALVSSNRGRLQSRASHGSRGAARALRLSENPSRVLATVQLGITLVGIIAGVFGGATIAEDFSLTLAEWGLEDHLASPLAFLVVVGAITYVSLVFGELVPKQISLAHPERIAILVSGPISLLATLSQPVVWLLDLSSRGVLAILPSSGPARSDVTEEDIHHALNEGAKVGEIRSLEKEMAMRIFRLDDRPITAFMTPRRDVVWLDSTGPLEDALQVALDSPHSFFPVSEGTLDNLLGVISVKELLHLERSGRTLSIRSLIKPIFKVPAGKDALGVLEDFKRERSQVAVVVDEHGGVSGVVTTHDLLEAIVGDLADFDGEAQSIVIRQDGSMLVDAGVDIHELLLKAGKDPSSAGPDEEYHSVGGLVFGELGKLPYVGASIEWNGLRFEIVDMDRNRIDKLLVSAPKALEAQNAAPPSNDR